jgi:hypothetical protein
MDEKRREPRIKVNWPIEAIAGNRSIDGTAKNITLKGIFVCCEEPLLLKRNISITIFPPNYKPINIIGKVVWSDSYALDLDEEKVPVCIGLSFIEISTENLSSLKEIVYAFG